jgi:hypothetical protein
MRSVIVLNVVMLSVIMQTVIMLNVVVTRCVPELLSNTRLRWTPAYYGTVVKTL